MDHCCVCSSWAAKKRYPILMANELPEDLVIQILVWLPVVSLLRFKSVCKSWFALITHQNFITEHLQHNKNTNTHLLLKMRDKTTEDYVCSTISYETLGVSLTQPLRSPFSEIDMKAVRPPDFQMDDEFAMEDQVEISIVGSCNGLVCLYDNYEFNTVIWNPATKETKVVPESNLPRIPDGYKISFVGIGFGFDAKTDDYKIINFLQFCDPLVVHGDIYQSEIYSLNANSWRNIDSPRCYPTDGNKGLKTYINRVASWEVMGYGWEGLLSFDMSDEVFLTTLLPNDVLEDEHQYGMDFYVLNESIAMVVRIMDDTLNLSFDVWLLGEVGVKDSWTKYFITESFLRIRRPLGFWKENTMFLENCDGQLVLYDSLIHDMIDIQVGKGAELSLQLVNYMESLVSVRRPK